MEASSSPDLAVVGCGLIGGSVALAARRAGLRVVVADPAVSAAEARRHGLSHAPDAASASSGVPLVVVAVPLDALPGVAAEVASAVDPGAVVTDVASVKRHSATVLDRALHDAGRNDVWLVPGHPMAGRETSGFASATEDLFDGASWVLCPQGVPQDAVDAVTALVRILGAARVVELDPAGHDAAVAAVSHLVQGASSALAAVVARAEDRRPGSVALAGGGFRDTTRVAESPLGMWAEVFAENRDEVVPLMRELADELSALADAVESGDAEALARTFDQAHRARDLYRRAFGRPAGPAAG